MNELTEKKTEIKLVQADALDFLAELPDHSADCILTDPPYFQGLTHNGARGNFADLAISRPFWKEFYTQCNRVLKPTGAFYQFTDWRGYAFFYPLAEEFLGVRNCIIWDKGSGAGNFYTFNHEFILFWTPNTLFRAKQPGARNVIRLHGFNAGAARTNGPKLHPTQKPLELIERLIGDSTDAGALVIDPFSGSGTTALACLRTGRNFSGCELQEKYVEIALHRLKENGL